MVKEVKVLFFLLFLHAFASLFTGMFEGGTLNPGTIRGSLVSIFVLYFMIRRLKFNNSMTIFLVIYLTYLGILTLSSSDFYNSFYNYVGVAISLMMLPIGLYYIDNEKRLFQLSKVFLYVLSFITITVLISNRLGLGTSDYLDDSFYFGYGRVNITKTMIVLLFSAPIYLYMEKVAFKKNIAIIIYVMSFAVCLIGIKRSVLLTLITGVVVYIFLGPGLKRSVKYLSVAGLIFLISFPLYGNIFLDRYEARLTSERFEYEAELESSGRGIEINMVYNSMLNEGLKHRLIGSEIFNDTQYFRTNRMLHTDYMILLNGSGILGLLGWLIFLLLLISNKIKLYNLDIKSDFNKILNGVFWILILSQVLISISGTIYSISLRSYLYLMIGGILSVLKTNYIDRHIN